MRIRSLYRRAACVVLTVDGVAIALHDIRHRAMSFVAVHPPVMGIVANLMKVATGSYH